MSLSVQSNWSVCAGWGLGRWGLGAMTCFLLVLEIIKTDNETHIPIDERRASNCRFHTKVQELQMCAFLQIICEYLQPSVSSWSRWGSRWPTLGSESPGGAVFFTTELLDQMKWKGNASKVKAIWRAHPARLHVQLSRLCLLAIRKAHSRLSGADPRSVSTVRQWHLFVELWMRYL